MNRKAKVSVIVPIYKCEEYLEKCILTIKKQTLKEIEIILVNDGSPDRCPQICDEYAKKDFRIKVIHKENGGLMAAWKTGLVASSGDYICFVDGDDYISNQMCEKLYKAIVENDADLACSSFYSIDQNNKEVKNVIVAENGVYQFNNIKEKIIPYYIYPKQGDYDRVLFACRWNKIFKRQLLINNMQYFDERVSYGEDLISTFPCVADAQKIVVLKDDYLYYYRYNPVSIMNSYKKNLEKQIEIVFNNLLQIFKEKCIKDTSQIYKNHAYNILAIILNEVRGPNTKKQKIQNIRKWCNAPIVRMSIRELTKTKKLGFKNRIKFILIKMKFARILYFLCKIRIKS